jgi:2-polyprenyl-6-methoxyphenol hydroxylase-like FAD-dependent oxidoreductase
MFAGAEPASEVLGWYHPLFRPQSYTPGGAWLIGDASGGIDPCLGMGISMALVEAHHAAGLLSERLRHPELTAQCDANYAVWHRDLFHHYHDFGRLFRLLVTTPVGSAALVGGMGLWPAAADRIFSSIAEMRPWPVPLWRTPAEGKAWSSTPLELARAGSDSP